MLEWEKKRLFTLEVIEFLEFLLIAQVLLKCRSRVVGCPPVGRFFPRYFQGFPWWAQEFGEPNMHPFRGSLVGVPPSLSPNG